MPRAAHAAHAGRCLSLHGSRLPQPWHCCLWVSFTIMRMRSPTLPFRRRRQKRGIAPADNVSPATIQSSVGTLTALATVERSVRDVAEYSDVGEEMPQQSVASVHEVDATVSAEPGEEAAVQAAGKHRCVEKKVSAVSPSAQSWNNRPCAHRHAVPRSGASMPTPATPWHRVGHDGQLERAQQPRPISRIVKEACAR